MKFRLQGSVLRISAVLGIIGVGLLALATPVYAQEGAAAPATAQGPAGIGILILLMGLAALGLIGLTYFAQARGYQDGDRHREPKPHEEE